MVFSLRQREEPLAIIGLINRAPEYCDSFPDGFRCDVLFLIIGSLKFTTPLCHLQTGLDGFGDLSAYMIT